ncbi:uncharacterized protein FA14DRAFT_178723 [Meira miltonrushii]|uniref:Uncharacterized protein n=1 Tax=Meira miltonrushii TaxID=1280837 RepID=A0A316VCI9_9BASI|nr:uncharacterized protein FA14DRAFT_178723 [Meira miltonrushii]PWN35349.1 hypothetical protein FA14DRAFT_178723 [Meira miltonrushii]
MARFSNSLSVMVVLIAFINVASAFYIVNYWPDNSVKQPKHFRAYPQDDVNSSGCEVEILFERDFNDQKYDYHIFANYDTADEPQYVPVKNYSESDKLAVVNATPQGQRGAYFRPNGYTLTPLMIEVCNPNYISLRIPLTPKSYFVKVVHAGKGPDSEAVYVSNTFGANDAATIVPPPGVTQVVATHKQSQHPNTNLVHVKWHLDTLFNDQVRGYFVLIGPAKGAKQVQSFYVDNANATETTVEIGYFVDGYAASVVVWSKDGVLTNPDLAPQVNIQ